MTDNILLELRSSNANFRNAIFRPLTVNRAKKSVSVNIVTDLAFTLGDKETAFKVLRKYVPEYFSLEIEITKLSPDCEMIKRKVLEYIGFCSKAVLATLDQNDISVEKRENGFYYTISVLKSLAPVDLCSQIDKLLKNNYCGEFVGELIFSDKDIDDIEVETEPDEIEFEMPIRRFPIVDFNPLEGEKIQTYAVYLADLNLVRDEVVLCGIIEDIKERSYTNKKGEEKTYYSFVINDKSASSMITYFTRQKSIEKIKALKVGDSIVCTGVNEEFRSNLRFTAKTIDYGSYPQGFIPEKRISKPVPAIYKHIHPQPFVDMEQTDLFNIKVIPECLKKEKFVVFDLETTGLNSSPVTGNMDKIIEIGAFKIENGEIKESFTTFINPQRQLPDEIVKLTGITDEMVRDAPIYEDVMPDFFKFCDGCVLVGHNAASFDFKFVDYYCSVLGYMFERKIIDTYPLSQELLFLSNYKLNTVADKFNVTFNHHRAIDDALATAKIFIELIRIKKSLPKY